MVDAVDYFTPQRVTFSPVERGRQRAQRFTDILISATLLLLLSPLYLLVWIIIRLSDGGPGLYRSERIGRGGKRFEFLKFRTMRVNSEGLLHQKLESCDHSRRQWHLYLKLDDDPRVTAIGGFLRRSSIDELPQLVNVLHGDMSLIGPRPILPNEIDRYGRWFRLYTDVRPGITGLWQVSGRSLSTFRRRIAADVIYIRRRTILLKVWILLATIPVVLGRKGSA